MGGLFSNGGRACFLFQLILNLFIDDVVKASGKMEEWILISRIVYCHVSGLECKRNNPSRKRNILE